MTMPGEGGEGEAAPETETEPTGAEATAPETEELEPGEGEGGEEFEELEYNGSKHKVPKQYVEPLRNGMLLQHDYTKKSETLAAEKRAWEESRAASDTADEELLTKRGQLAHAESTIREYEKLNWASLTPEEAQLRRFELSELRSWRGNLKEDITEARQKSDDAQRQTNARRVREAFDTMQRAVPNWATVGPKVGEYAMQEYGLSVAQLARLEAPMIKALHGAWRGSQLEAAQKKAASQKPAPEETEPIKPAARVNRGSANASTGLSDRLDTDSWIEKRNAQIAARAQHKRVA